MRKRAFRLESSFQRSKDGTDTFIKAPCTKKAEKFIDEILKRELLAEQHFGNDIKVVRGRKVGNSIIYKYYHMDSLEDKIRAAMLCRSHKDLQYWTDKYVNFIYGLCVGELEPWRFYAEFKIKEKSTLKCLDFGPIDCIPSNILYNDGQIVIIDHEWTFDFPIPADLIIVRGLMTMINRLQKEIMGLYEINAENKVFYKRRQLYAPMEWGQWFDRMTLSPETLYNWNYMFQRRMTRQWITKKANRYPRIEYLSADT